MAIGMVPLMALALEDTDDSPPTDGDFVEGDFLLPVLLGCFDRLSDAIGRPMVLFVFNN